VPFDLQPVLHGEHLTIRPLRKADFEALYAVASDPGIWEQHPDPNRHRREVFTEFFADALASGGALVVLDAAGEVIGSSRFHGHDEQRSEVEVGWTFLARACWGGRVNRELKTLMLRHALRYVDQVVFLVGPQNHRSQGALAKIGAVPAGTRLDGAGRENLLFAVRRAADASAHASGT
jgi:N-acetyltransferase